MLLLSGFQNPVAFVVFLVALILAVTVHEFAHALVADKLGDSTPRMAGRVTLNPLAHLDPIGSLMLLVAGFGWGKPVMIQSGNFTNPALDEFLVAFAGPASNLIQAVLAGLLARQLVPYSDVFPAFLALVVQINIMLMLFNLLPIPPLDGSKFLRLIIDETTFRSLEAMSLPLIIGLFVILQTTSLGFMLSKVAAQLTTWILGV